MAVFSRVRISERTARLRSRAFFDDVLQREWSACMRDSRAVTLFYFDVGDKFTDLVTR